MTKTFRDQRLALGLTQKELATQCAEKGAQVSDVTLSAIERGLWAPRPRLRAVLCTILSLPIAYFDERADEQVTR
ncbi:helix-turn-helix domain-containing protein [Spirillospora sp. NBC_00431]